MSEMSLVNEIAELKRARNAVILAHNYCRGEVQDVADYTGDSLELARRATQVEADVIVFCGVYFMAETAKILNPAKTVLIPDPTAGCPMADMITGAQLRALKAEHPQAKAVCYVNSTAEVKAECDMCVTSGNAEKVMKTFAPDQEILFVPDQHLGGYIAGKLGRSYHCWQGYCPIHARLTAEQIKSIKVNLASDKVASANISADKVASANVSADKAALAKVSPNDANRPYATLNDPIPVLVHPECSKAVRDAADECLSTGGMCKFVKESPLKEFIIGTEAGILHRLRKENPDKIFHPVGDLCCEDMKKITLENLRAALLEVGGMSGSGRVVEVDAEIARKAKRAIEAMLEIS